MSYTKKIHFKHPDGGTVCDHKNAGGENYLYVLTKKKDEVTCIRCNDILSGKFGGKPFEPPWLANCEG